MAGRGQITPELEVMAKEKLGITLTVRSLRLLPYMQYVLMNGGQLNRRSVNDDERALLDHWDDLGLIRIHGLTVKATKRFWDGMNEILWAGYVDHDNLEAPVEKS